MKTEIKELVAEGKVDEALDQLVAFLGGQIDQFSPLYRAAQVAQSEYNQTKEKELQGLLTEDQVRLANNIAINKVLEILEQVDRGVTPTPPAVRQQWWWYALGGVVLTLLVIFLLFKNSKGSSEPIVLPPPTTDTLTSSPVACPNFAANTQYGIAIFDFTTRTGQEDNADVFLVQEIDKIFDRNGFAGDAILIEDYEGPLDATMAKSLLKACNVQMVIWGQVFSQEEIDLNFYAPNLEQKDKVELDSLLQFREQGNFQASIKQAALIIASRVLVDNNANGAVAVAEKAYQETMKSNSVAAKTAKKSNAESMATMTLANAHARNKDYKKSISLYHDILDKKPQDTVARRNLVIAEIKSNNIEVAIKNLDTLRDHQKKQDPVLLDKVGDALTEKGLTRKGAQFKKDAKIIFKRDSVNLRIKQQ